MTPFSPNRPRRTRRIRHFTTICIATLALPLHAATYYIDHATGNNANDGLAPAKAWKHSPGDTAATGNPAAITLSAGDTIIFKGGVTYHGALSLSVSGAPGQPITYDGNTAGSYGEGPAILDGGRPVVGWHPVTDAADVKDNPRWREMFYADIDVDVTSNARGDQVVLHRQVPPALQAPWQRVMLSDGDRQILPIAQLPKPKDDFFPDLPADFNLTPGKLEVRDGLTRLIDPERLVSKDPQAYDGVLVGIHGGNNHVYFAAVKHYDPVAHRLSFPEFKHKIYDQTRYALYNSPAFILRPGEWTITPLGNGKSRIHLLPLRLENGLPANVAYPVHDTAVALVGGASHLRVQGFLIRRYSGGQGGVSVARNNNPRSRDIAISGNEIRFVSGHAGIGVNHADDILVANNVIRHCPGWTSGIFISRVNDIRITGNRLDKNSGSGIRFYEGRSALIAGNTILDHYGMHSSGLNLYTGCADVVVENNFIENVITMNRNAERITIRNNIVDAQNRAATTLALWFSGNVGGTAIRDIHILNNTMINTDQAIQWSNGLFGQPGKVSPPEGMVVRGNIMDRPRGVMTGAFENNIYLREPEAKFMGAGNHIVSDLNTLFRDPEKRDFRRKPGGPAMDIGADLPPPPSK